MSWYRNVKNIIFQQESEDESISGKYYREVGNIMNVMCIACYLGIFYVVGKILLT